MSKKKNPSDINTQIKQEDYDKSEQMSPVEPQEKGDVKVNLQVTVIMYFNLSEVKNLGLRRTVVIKKLIFLTEKKIQQRQ